MPTQTIFQELKLATGTWIIEVVAPETADYEPKGIDQDADVRTQIPTDPWWEMSDTTLIPAYKPRGY